MIGSIPNDPDNLTTIRRGGGTPGINISLLNNLSRVTASPRPRRSRSEIKLVASLDFFDSSWVTDVSLEVPSSWKPREIA